MRYIALLITSFALMNPISAADPAKFSIATWNLEWYFDEYAGDNNSELAKQQSAPTRADWDWKRDAVADAIAKLDVDVIGVQEVENSRVLWYTERALDRNHQQQFKVAFAEGGDMFTEQDVGFLYRNVNPLKITRHLRPIKTDSQATFYDVTKHLQFEFSIPAENPSERIIVLNVHLRSKPEGAELRERQARLIRHWIDEAIQSGTEVILMGDTNSELRAGNVAPSSDLGILLGLGTSGQSDDLVDLHERIPADKRITHLVPHNQFDRILVTSGLLVDDPTKRDLVLVDIQVRADVCIRGDGVDDVTEHFENYWKLPANQRDISDHYPVVARFEFR